MPFLARPTLRPVGMLRWVTLVPLPYRGNPDHGGDLWTIPAGFGTDLASVPLCMTWAVARYGIWTAACILHDWLCFLVRQGRMLQRDADGVLRRVLREEGVPPVQCWAMWAAVRAGSHLKGATRTEALQVLGIGLCAFPLLLFSLLLVWPAQRIVKLLEAL